MMKKFILKSSIFIIPFIFSYLMYFSTHNGGNDLSRLGNLNTEYKFFETYNNFLFDSIYYDFPNNTKKHYKILNIGDSFSRQELYEINGYVNYLSKSEIVLNMPFSDPVKRLKECIKNNYLDTLGVKYVILQSVQRHIIPRLLNDKLTLEKKSFKKVVSDDNRNKIRYINLYEKNQQPAGFFSKSTLFFGINYLYEKDIRNNVIRFKTKDNLFSYPKKELLVFREDIDALKYYNFNQINDANSELNKLALQLKRKNIKLLVLISPDKYDFYYQNIINSNYAKPTFFNVLDSLQKEYIYINSKELLNIPKSKDQYFFDDTHWSPLSAKIIAEKISALVK